MTDSANVACWSMNGGSKEGFKYGNIISSLVREEKTDSWIYQIVIVLRKRNFKHDRESEEYVTLLQPQ